MPEEQSENRASRDEGRGKGSGKGQRRDFSGKRGAAPSGGGRRQGTERRSSGDRRPGGSRDGREGSDQGELQTPSVHKVARAYLPERSRHNDPDIPDEIEPRMLDGQARGELKTLAKDNADWVAKHLVMAGALIDSDPELAHQHALSASRRAGRVGVVRETVGLTAYAIGDFALALRELRTYRRISGSDLQTPVMVDAERGLGRAEAALELGRGVDTSTLTPGARVELAIAMSGARLDLGQTQEALIELQVSELNPDVAYPYSPRLFYAYAEVLSDLGSEAEAAQWRARAEVAAQALAEADPGDGQDDIEVVEIDGGDQEDSSAGVEERP